MWPWMTLSKVHSSRLWPGHLELLNATLCDTIGNGSSGSSGSSAHYCFTHLLICYSLFRVHVFFLRSFSLPRSLKQTTVSVPSEAKDVIIQEQTCRVREDLVCVCAWCVSVCVRVCVCVFMCMCMHDIDHTAVFTILERGLSQRLPSSTLNYPTTVGNKQLFTSSQLHTCQNLVSFCVFDSIASFSIRVFGLNSAKSPNSHLIAFS